MTKRQFGERFEKALGIGVFFVGIMALGIASLVGLVAWWKVRKPRGNT